MKFSLTALCLSLLAVTLSSEASRVTIGASTKDTVIFANNVNNSLGGGIVMFAGTNAATSPRRGLVQFDLPAELAGATIDSVSLTLTYATFASGGGGAGSNAAPDDAIELHKLLSNWGEGTVGTGTGTGGVGQGFPANPGDATWSSAFYQSQPWTTAGGDFTTTTSASKLVGGTTVNIPFTWSSTPQLVADVQSWVDHPSSNFGWLLKGDESTIQTFRGFYTRESTTAGFRPTLTIGYTTPVPEASSLALLSVLGAIGLWRRRVHSGR